MPQRKSCEALDLLRFLTIHDREFMNEYFHNLSKLFRQSYLSCSKHSMAYLSLQGQDPSAGLSKFLLGVQLFNYRLFPLSDPVANRNRLSLFHKAYRP